MNKKTAGVVRQKWSPMESRFCFEALNFYDEVMYINPRRVTFNLDRGSKTIQIEHEGERLNDLSMLYTFGYATETLLLAKSMAMCGCPTSDPYHMISRDSLGKLTDLLNLHDAGIGTSAHLLPSVEAATEYLDHLSAQSYPLVRKPVAGNRGRGIKKIENKQEALKVATAHFERSRDVLLLERYMNFEHEYRVYTIDGAPVAAYRRVKGEGKVASNIYQGGSIYAVNETVAQDLFDQLAARILDRFSIGIYGFDLGVTDAGDTHIIEVNRTPGFGGLTRLKLLNLPRRAHEIIHKRARASVNTGQTRVSDYVITFLGDTNPGHSYQERLAEKVVPPFSNNAVISLVLRSSATFSRPPALPLPISRFA